MSWCDIDICVQPHHTNVYPTSTQPRKLILGMQHYFNLTRWNMNHNTTTREQNNLNGQYNLNLFCMSLHPIHINPIPSILHSYQIPCLCNQFQYAYSNYITKKEQILNIHIPFSWRTKDWINLKLHKIPSFCQQVVA
jgi:hypothetical protein